jgi:hypothetical protein
VFGFKKPFRFFDLSASRSLSPITWIGIGSVSVTAKWGHRKSVWILRLSKAKTEGAWDSESPGRRFESFQAHQFHRNLIVIAFGPRDHSPLVHPVEANPSPRFTMSGHGYAMTPACRIFACMKHPESADYYTLPTNAVLVTNL